MRYAVPSILLLLVATTASPQTPASHPEALDLLTRVAQRYADAKTYDIEAITEQTSTGELSRSWWKTILIAAEAPRGRFHFEGHTGQGSSLAISDGKTTWDYRFEEHRYTAKPSLPDSGPSGPISLGEMGATNAKMLRGQLQSMAEHLVSAEFLPDEELKMDGRQVRCKVVHITNDDEKRNNPNQKVDKRIWIDDERNLILKISEKSDGFLMVASGRIPLVMETTTIYTKTNFDLPSTSELFAFNPPAGAREIAEFPDPSESFGLSSMAGDHIPPLKFKAADGTVKSVESFRGKPVLIDFWATWCAPCVAAMPKLAELYKEAKSKGMVLISVDQDEEASKAAEFLEKHGYEWENFHDGDGAIAKLLPSSGIPHMVLVDSKGTVAYDTTGGDDNRLRMHIAKLGPEFADLAPKPKAPPCNVAPQSSR